MSMRDHPANGYYLPVNVFQRFLSTEEIAELDENIEDFNYDAALELLNSVLPQGFPLIQMIYVPNDEDNISDTTMKSGEAYAYYHVEDLYEMTKKPQLIHLESLGIAPEYGNWSVFG